MPTPIRQIKLTSRVRNQSKALEKEWVSLQKAEKDDDIVSFDCEAHLHKCKELDVASYPAIRVYHRDGRMDRYRGEPKGRRCVSRQRWKKAVP